MHELSHFRWDVTGLAEIYWTELDVNRCKIINPGGEGKHEAGVALVLSSLAPKCMLGFRPVNN